MTQVTKVMASKRTRRRNTNVPVKPGNLNKFREQKEPGAKTYGYTGGVVAPPMKVR